MKKILGALFFITAITGYIYLQKDTPSLNRNEDKVIQKTEVDAPVVKQEESPQTSFQQLPPEKEASPAELEKDLDIPSYLSEFEKISKQHKLSLIETTQRIFRFAKRDVKSQDLVAEFEQKALAPELRVDSNPYTGTLSVVRTRKVLPGTRYFHAQFFENEDGSEYLQHISFEFKGSEQSFEAVKKTILQQFASMAVEQTQNNENFKSWRRDDGYIIWMRKLDETDIKDNPFNVYTKEDIGTIRVAIELDIHDHSPAFHAEQGPFEEE